ncbi:MAG: hypothetical protein AABX29_00690 [Nanoarchaeota archaeon]
MPTFEIKKFKCPRCGRMYEDSVRGNFPGKPCKECTEQTIKITALERQLIAQDFSIEQEDEKIARQINDLLVKESSGVSERDEQILTALTERMLKDEKRRKNILKQILRLQKEKR